MICLIENALLVRLTTRLIDMRSRALRRWSFQTLHPRMTLRRVPWMSLQIRTRAISLLVRSETGVTRLLRAAMIKALTTLKITVMLAVRTFIALGAVPLLARAEAHVAGLMGAILRAAMVKALTTLRTTVVLAMRTFIALGAVPMLARAEAHVAGLLGTVLRTAMIEALTPLRATVVLAVGTFIALRAIPLLARPKAHVAVLGAAMIESLTTLRTVVVLAAWAFVALRAIPLLTRRKGHVAGLLGTVVRASMIKALTPLRTTVVLAVRTFVALGAIPLLARHKGHIPRLLGAIELAAMTPTGTTSETAAMAELAGSRRPEGRCLARVVQTLAGQGVDARQRDREGDRHADVRLPAPGRDGYHSAALDRPDNLPGREARRALTREELLV